MCFLRVAMLGLLVSACGAATTETGESGARGAASWEGRGDDPVAGRMREIAGRLEAAGLGSDGPNGRGFLTAREQRTEELTVPAGRCATIVAVTSRGIRDLDATLFAPTGDVLAEDVEPDAHPTIQVCASVDAPRRLYYSLNAYDGAGSYLYVAFLGDRRSFAAAASVIGGQPGVVSDGDGQSDQDVRLHELSQGVARRGFEAFGTPVPVPLVPDQRVRLPLRTELGACYTVIALGMPGLSDLNLRILSDAGDELAVDDTPSRDASVQLCTDRAADFSVELHAAGGRGQARVAFFKGDQARVGGDSGLWLGERREGRRVRRDVGEATSSAIARAEQNGWRVGGRSEGGLVSGGAASERLALPAGRCSRILATGGRGLGRLLLRIVDERGRTLVERGGAAASATATICPETSVDVTAQVVSRRGEGRFTLTHLTKAPPTDLDGGSAVARGAVVGALERADADGYALERREVLRGAQAGVSVGTDAGCLRVVAVARGEGGGVVATLRRGGELVSRNLGPSAQVVSCDPPAELQLTIDPIDGDGSIEILRFRKAQ